MRADSLPGQVVAVLSRRATAFQPHPEEPQTFPGRLRAVVRRRDTNAPAPHPTASTPARDGVGAMGRALLTVSVGRHAGARRAVRMGRVATARVWLSPGGLKNATGSHGFHGLLEALAALDPRTRMALRDHPTVITLIRALDPARGLDHEPYAARVLGDAPDLARAHLRVRTRVGTRVRTRARARVIALAIDSALVLLGAEFVIRSEDVARASDQELRLVRVAVDDLRNDFTGADLRGLNLSGVELDGVRWSAATQWPPHSIDEVRRVSVEVSPGIFEVRGYGRLGDGMSVDPTWG